MCQEQAGAAGGDGGAPGDAGADAGFVPIACHVERDQKGWVTPVCRLEGHGVDGERCGASADCATGHECVSERDGKVCRHYCCNNTCAQPDAASNPPFCDIEPVVAPDAYRVPVCVHRRACTLLSPCVNADGTLDPDQTCTIVDANGDTACVAKGPLGVGDSCETDHCADTLACWGTFPTRKCTQLCDLTKPASCPAGKLCFGNSANFKQPNIGVCRAAN